jgi:hypothetical protein
MVADVVGIDVFLGLLPLHRLPPAVFSKVVKGNSFNDEKRSNRDCHDVP